MKLNNVVYDALRKERDGLYKYDDNHVMLKKPMPVSDKRLDVYIENIKRAISNGLNTVPVIDYKLYPETKFVVNDDISYTHGLFLEEKARGNSFGYQNIFIIDNDNHVNFEKEAIDYINVVNKYIDEIELRSNAPQEFYDKLVSDYVKFNEFDLEVDPKPTNFFFDKTKGFIFIDLLDHKDVKLNRDYLVNYLVGAIMGYGKPFVSMGRLYVREISKDLNDKYKKCLSEICNKLSLALVNNKLDDLKEKVPFEVNHKALLSDKCVEFVDTSNYLALTFAENRRKREAIKKQANDFKLK